MASQPSSTQEENLRLIRLGGQAHPEFVPNTIQSSRFSLLTLLPKSILEQFNRFSNIWFLIVSVFQLIFTPIDSAAGWNTFVPLVLMLMLTLAKDAYLLYKQYTYDRAVNKKQTEVWHFGTFRTAKWGQVAVGQVVLVKEGETAPADLLVLGCGSYEEICYADATILLDGRNMTARKPVKETQATLKCRELEESTERVGKLQGEVMVQQPSPDFHSFSGKLKLHGFPTASRLVPANLFLRGSSLVATPWIIGLVVYTGTDTKAVLNCPRQQRKTTALERRVNRLVLFLLPVLLLPTLISAILSEFASVQDVDNTNFFEKFVNFCLLYNNVIPISLFMTMDLVRLAQGLAIHHGDPNISINNTDVSEDMGQIEYVVASKNGTVTEDQLIIKAISIDDKEYIANTGPDTSEIKHRHSRSVIDDSHIVFQRGNELKQSKTVEPEVPSSDTLDYDQLLKALQNSESYTQKRLIEAIALCNSLQSSESDFLGPAEEKALATDVQQFKYKLVFKGKDACTLEVEGKLLNWTVFGCTAQFQESKRTRIFLQGPGDNFGILFIKGPGSVTKEILDLPFDELCAVTEVEEKYQRSGLRTLLYACKVFPQAEISEFAKELRDANHSLFNRDDKVDNIFQKYEHNAHLLGVIGLEEAIAQDTKETVKVLQSAGVTIWLASADAELPTVTTAFNLGLYPPDTEVVSLKQKTDDEELVDLLKKAMRQFIIAVRTPQLSRSGTLMLDKRSDLISMAQIIHSQSKEREISSQALFRRASLLHEDQLYKLQLSDTASVFSISMDGVSLETALKSSDCKKLLIPLLLTAKGVAFHQLLPLQKALVVRMLKELFDFRPITLAIGSIDADIPMLMEAHVGVGLRKDDFSRVSEVSDVGLASFSGLENLLLVHGRWDLMRMEKVVLLFVFKNLSLAFFLMAYIFFCDYQSPSLFTPGLIACYNVFFTTIPVLVIGVWDEDLTILQQLSRPIIYQTGIRGGFLTYGKFILYWLLALFEVLVIAVTMVPSLDHILTSSGFPESFDLDGVAIFIALVTAMLGQTSLVTASISLSFCSSVFLCMSLLYSYIFASVAMDWDDLDGTMNILYKSGPCVMRILLAPAAACTLFYAVLTYMRIFRPTLVDIIQQGYNLSSELSTWSRIKQYTSDLTQVYRSSSRPDTAQEIDSSKVHPVTLHFSSKYVEKEYQFEFFNQLKSVFRVLISILICLLVIWLIYNSVQFSQTGYAAAQSLMIIMFLLVLVATRLKAFKKNFIYITISGVTVTILVKFLTELLFHTVGGLSSSIVPVVTFGILNVDFLANVAVNAMSLGLIAISMSLNFMLWSTLDKTMSTLYIITFLVLISGVFVTCSILGYHTAKRDRLHFKLGTTIEAQAEKVRSILGCFLPKFVREQVRRGKRYIAEEKGVVTVIFCDICDFDAICASLTPVELTSFLDDLFQQFDSACDMNGVFKVETVGKTYMACAGLKDSEQGMDTEICQNSHARRAVELAFHILRIVQRYRLANGSAVQVKIGINSGPVVAGVVGFHKPQFSLVGDTVNTASRMCSTIETSDTVQISEATYRLIGDQQGIRFQVHDLKAVKGKGDMTAYFVYEEPISLPRSREHETTINSSTDERRDSKPAIFQIPESEASTQRNAASPEASQKPIWKQLCAHSQDRALRLTVLKDSFPVIKWGLITAAGVRVTIVLLRAIEYSQMETVSNDECVVAYAISAGCTCLMALTLPRFYRHHLFSYTMFGFTLVSTLFCLSDIFYQTDYDTDLITLEVMYGTLLLTFCSGLSYHWTVLGTVIVSALWSAAVPFAKDASLHMANLTFIIGFAAINVYAASAQERRIRSYNDLKQYAEKEIEQTDELLSHMLPPHVYEGLKQEQNVAEHFSNVTILFADIVGFTSWSSDKTPVQIVSMLNELFTQFDRLCVSNNIYKVHTIGDCYVAMGYAGEPDLRDVRSECLHVLDQALDMVKVIQEINEKNGSSLNMRIGIHTGEVIAGITGTNVVRYDIYGPDVLIANKMESNGQAGKVNVSDVTKTILEAGNERFEFAFNREVEAKAVSRKHQAYFIIGGRKERIHRMGSKSDARVAAIRLPKDVDARKSLGEDRDITTAQVALDCLRFSPESSEPTFVSLMERKVSDERRKVNHGVGYEIFVGQSG